MVLMHTAALGALRKELIQSVGREHTRRILTRMGYASGLRDAQLTKRIRGDLPLHEAFLTGPQLHALEGVVKVTPKRLEMDVESGRFDGEFYWENSWEAEVHQRDFGLENEPVCWSQIGYASGYSTGFMGRFILFKEVECVASGHNRCRIVGKPVEDWDDAAEHTPYYQSDPMLDHLLDLRTQVDYLRTTLTQQTPTPNLVGASKGFKAAYDLIARAAGTHVSVLLLGETGVGKERFARALHLMSSRRQGPFVAVNCAALPHDLIESELFGVEKGAFSGAHATRIGKFERAEGGTLLLDEVGELSLPAQAKLLRVLQEGEIERLGDERTRKVNVRIVAATNVDLQCAAKQGKFRLDLFYRLNVYPILIPPLRERIADIAPLVDAMLARLCTLHDKKVRGLTDRTLQALKRYPWPGNVRELENMIERGVILAAPGGWIELEHLLTHFSDTSAWQSTLVDKGLLDAPEKPPCCSGVLDTLLASGLSLDALEAELLTSAVKRSEGNLANAARLLGITRPQLQYRLKRNATPA
jgi:DNA-binding NtrC family response regulator